VRTRTKRGRKMKRGAERWVAWEVSGVKRPENPLTSIRGRCEEGGWKTGDWESAHG